MTWGPFELTAKAALITGAARGIGLGCARRFREAGAHVLVADIDGEAAAGAVAQLDELPGGGALASCELDVGDPESAEAAVQRCVDGFGSIDVLVNNAGVYPAADFGDLTQEHIRYVLRVNVEGLILMTRAAALPMIGRGHGGAVVNLASVGALRGLHPGLVTYGASKGAVISFTRRAAGALGSHAIRVNAIAPGTIVTEGAAALGAQESSAEASALADAASRIPLGRTGTPDDIATVAVFLASDAARYVTGTTVIVDGGAMVV